MKQRASLELIVGIFMLAGIAALVVLAFKVSSLSNRIHGDSFMVQAEFDNVGNLKPRAAVRVAGVRVGQVANIELDPKSFKAVVTLKISEHKGEELPVDSSASILTEGLLGANYINLTPGFEDDTLKEGDMIEVTHSAMILENLIGHLLFNADKAKQ